MLCWATVWTVVVVVTVVGVVCVLLATVVIVDLGASVKAEGVEELVTDVVTGVVV